MCGLAGFLDPGLRYGPHAGRAIVTRMADRIAHRGPDDAALWVDGEAGVALGFRRLAILDLSPAGRQPMVSADGGLVMIYNGEIYNHRELRAELDAAGGGPWRGHSDSETLLALVARVGFVPALERLNGMFAIALWDRAARRLWLARDRFGEKPLYYGTQGGVFLFGSELKALAAHPAWTGALDPAALGLYLRHDYVPAPYSAFAGIAKLPAGSWLGVDARGETRGPTLYWDAAREAAAAAASPFAGDLAAAGAAAQALVDDAVRLRLEADVPLGAFLSGGIDSASVVAAMQRARPGGVRTFTIGFPGTDYDESPAAAQIAAHLGTEHTTLAVGEDECRALLPGLAPVYDEPFADASAIPTLMLCRLTRERVTVSLSGDGGDELFGGYARYRDAAAAWRRLEPMPGALRQAAGRLASGLGGNERRLARRLKKHAGAWSHETPESLYRDYVTRWRPGDGIRSGLPSAASLFDAPLAGALPSLAQEFMLRDTLTYLPDDLLVKVDRASMAVGLEARAPLLDHRIALFAWSLPPALMASPETKLVLRRALAPHLPPALVAGRKRGFEPPVGAWLRSGLRAWADDLLAPARLERHGLVMADTVAKRWSEHRAGTRSWTYPLWNVLMLEAWFDHAAEKA
jgi:asparagine synthase (glutamine-hydrolysing)